MQKTWSIIDIIHWGENYFKVKGIESPRLNIELLLCHTLKINRIEIYTHYDKPLNDDELNLLRQSIKRRTNREPLQYIFGKTDFFGASIALDQSVLIPRPETEFLAAEAAKIIENNNFKSILDIGSGSGCIAISLAKKFPYSNFLAIDISEKAIEIAKENAKYNNVDNVYFEKIDVLKEKPKNKYELIISNPPYVPQSEYLVLEPDVRYYEPRYALTDEKDGLTFYHRFADIFKDILLPNGMFVLEIGAGQKKYVVDLFSMEFTLMSIKDFSMIERFIIGKRKPA